MEDKVLKISKEKDRVILHTAINCRFPYRVYANHEESEDIKVGDTIEHDGSGFNAAFFIKKVSETNG